MARPYLRAAASKKLASATISVIAASLICASGASAAGSMVVQTPSLDFGRGVVGGTGTATKNVELYNSTSSTLQLTEMTLNGGISDFIPSFADGTTCPTPSAGASAGVAPGATCAVTVTYSPFTFGPVGGLLNMTFCPADSTACVTTSDVSLAGDGVQAETLSLTPSSPLTFASTLLNTSSPTQTVTLTNGATPMLINGLSFSGVAPHDFAIGQDGCTGTQLTPGASCTFNVRFAPTQSGARTATLAVNGATIGNPYPTMTLSGVGFGLPVGPPTPPTPPGPTTPTRHTDPRKPDHGSGQSDLVELVTCRTVTRVQGHPRHKVKVQQCTARRVLHSVTFTADAATTRATISRGAAVYATGSATSRGAHRWQLVIHQVRRLRPGNYTLTLRTGHGAPHRLPLTVK